MKRLIWTAILIAALVPSGWAADGVKIVKDLDYVEGRDYAENKDKLDLYLPEGQSNFPVLVFFHGGGLMRGDKEGSENVGMALAGAGVGAAVANYRLSPNVAHPEHAEDAARAIAWVHANIEDHGGNPEKIFISGHSAGGYLSALLALDPRYLKAEGLSPSSLAGSMPIAGFFYVDEIAPDRPKDVWGEKTATWKEASPSQYLSADAPPLLFLYADGDDPWRREQNERIASALAKKGHGDVKAKQIDDRDHGGIHGKIAPGDTTLDAMLAFIKSR